MSQSATAEKLLDSAERRVRDAGYNGFSFRDLAVDLGIKSASVHYHFPTKEKLVVALAARYADRFMAKLADSPGGAARVEAFRSQFRASIEQDRKMCLCGMLAAQTKGLPEGVVLETKKFFERIHAFLSDGLEGCVSSPKDEAFKILARLEGALVLARALGSNDVFEIASSDLLHPSIP